MQLATKRSAAMIGGNERGMHGAQGKPREPGATHIGRVRGGSLEDMLLKLNLQSKQRSERQRRETKECQPIKE